MADKYYQGETNGLINNLTMNVKDPLKEIVSRILTILDPDQYTWNAVLVLLFNHIDLLGHLLSGDVSKANQAKSAVKFIRTYLGKVDEKYAMTGGFIYYMLGNSLIPRFFPGSYDTGDGRMLRFVFSDTQEQQKHLSITQADKELRLIFSVKQFYKDLLDAIELYCLDVKTDGSLQEKYRQVRSHLTEPKDRSQINNHAYILASDLGFINDQIL